MSPPLSLSSSCGEKEEVRSCAFIYKYCRMCAVQLKQGVFIFGDEGARLQIPEKIRKTLAILVLEEDTLPKKICTSCCSSLEDYSQYKDTVLDAQEKLASIAKTLEARKERDHGQGSQISPRTSPLALLPPPPPGSILQQALTSSATVFVEEQPSPGGGGDDMTMTTPPGSPLAIRDVSDEKKDPKLESSSIQVAVISSPPPSPRPEQDKPVATPPRDQAPASGGWKCPTCDKNYQSRRGLELHAVIHNPAARFECEICDKFFNQKASLLHHMTSSHSSSKDERPFSCETCPKTFLTSKHLRRHTRFHNEPAAESPCTICGKVFKSALHLQNHMKGHRSKLNFPCLHPGCGKRFLNANKLSTHSNSHTGARTFQCGSCDYAARTPGPFYKHLKIHKKKEERSQRSEEKETPRVEEESVNLTLNFSVLEDLSNKSPPKGGGPVRVAPPVTSSGSGVISGHGASHGGPNFHGHQAHSHSMEFSEGQGQSSGQISQAHASSQPQLSYHHSPNSSHAQNGSGWNSKQSSYPTTTLELVDCSGITHAFPCDQLPPPPNYHNHSSSYNYSTPSHAHHTPITTTSILHTSPSAHHSSSGGGVTFISTSAPSSSGHVTILSGGGSHTHQDEPMELSYKLHLENVSQDVPMELTKVVFVQRDPLQLCVRDQQGQGQSQGQSQGQGHDEFAPLMDLSSARVHLNGDLNLSLNNNSIINGWGGGSYHCKDLAERELTFNDLSGAFRQPIDLIARGPDDPHGSGGDDLSTSEGNLVDLSLRSGFQDASTSSFLRELIDLSARSESFHGNGSNGELNLTNKQQTPPNSHSHLHHHHRGGSQGQSQGQGASLSSVIYQDAMFSL